MTTQFIDRPETRYLKFDDYGNAYSIPASQIDDFIYAVEAVTNAEWGSDEWGEASDFFYDEFNQYKKD